jgi:hypothetical protein
MRRTSGGCDGSKDSDPIGIEIGPATSGLTVTVTARARARALLSHEVVAGLVVELRTDLSVLDLQPADPSEPPDGCPFASRIS